MKAKCLVTLALAALGPGLFATLGQAVTELRTEPSRACVFAGDSFTLPVVIHTDQTFSGLLSWSLWLDRHVVGRREQAVEVLPGALSSVSLEMTLPEVRDGISLECRLQLDLTDRQGHAMASRQMPLTVFVRDPFALKRRWIERLPLHLFDPEGHTATAFEATGIPFQPIRSLDALDPSHGGVLVIGEGLSLEAYRGVFNEAVRLAAAGRAVFVMAPSDGEFFLPGATDETSLPVGVALRMHDVIGSFDKRFEEHYWRRDSRNRSAAFQLAGYRDLPVFKVGAHGWPWVEFSWPGNRRMLVCGFSMIRDWETSPVPRYLLADILEYLKNNKP